jgi:hypothetical protein
MKGEAAILYTIVASSCIVYDVAVDSTFRKHTSLQGKQASQPCDPQCGGYEH